MKNINPLGLFDDHFLLETLSKLGDPLLKLNEYIDWNIFKSPLACIIHKPKFRQKIDAFGTGGPENWFS